jgi:hypothetical protein
MSQLRQWSKQAARKYADNNTGSVKLDNEVICISGTK